MLPAPSGERGHRPPVDPGLPTNTVALQEAGTGPPGSCTGSVRICRLPRPHQAIIEDNRFFGGYRGCGQGRACRPPDGGGRTGKAASAEGGATSIWTEERQPAAAVHRAEAQGAGDELGKPDKGSRVTPTYVESCGIQAVRADGTGCARCFGSAAPCRPYHR